jgi:hypothetical protein
MSGLLEMLMPMTMATRSAMAMLDGDGDRNERCVAMPMAMRDGDAR